jgi:hypothetical protein
MALSKDIAAQIDAAFDFRGHVTITFTDGKKVEGYIYNRALEGAEPFIDYFPKDSDQRVRAKAETIAKIELTGKDFAVPFTPPAK